MPKNGRLDETPPPPVGSSWLAPNSKMRQYLSVAMAGLGVFTMGGLCFGFDSIYPVLYSGGAFLDYCPAEEATACAERPFAARSEKCCESQLAAFVTLTSVSLFGADGVMVIYGEIVDRAGPRWCMSVALALAWLGLGLVALNASLGALQLDWIWLVAFPMLGMAGPGIFMAVLSFGEVYPRLEPIITPLAASMFDGSAFVFLFWKLLFLGAGLPLSLIACLWLVVAVAVGLFTFALLLSRKQTERMRVQHAEHEKSSEMQPAVEDGEPTTETIRDLHWHAEGDGLTQLFFRTDTVLLLTFMCLANLNQSFYIETFADQARHLLPEEQAGEIVEMFDVVFPLLSVATTPLAIFLVNRFNHQEHVYLAVVVLLSNLFGLTQLLPYRSTQFLAAVFFGPARTLQWACYFHFLATPNRYPSAAMGRMVGYANLLIAVLGDGPPYLLNAYIQGGQSSAEESRRYMMVHACLMVLVAAVSVALPLQLWHAARQRSSRLLCATLRASPSFNDSDMGDGISLHRVTVAGVGTGTRKEPPRALEPVEAGVDGVTGAGGGGQRDDAESTDSGIRKNARLG